VRSSNRTGFAAGSTVVGIRSRARATRIQPGADLSCILHTGGLPGRTETGHYPRKRARPRA
jgi:hypothetical protein